MFEKEPISRNKLNNARKAVKAARQAYHAARRAALAVSARVPSKWTGEPVRPYAREQALDVAWHARYDYHVALRRLAAAERRPIAKGGAIISPAARERAFASGRWKRE